MVIAHAKQTVDFGIGTFSLDRVWVSKDQEFTMVVFQNYPRAIPVISGPERKRILAFVEIALYSSELEIIVLAHKTQ